MTNYTISIKTKFNQIIQELKALLKEKRNNTKNVPNLILTNTTKIRRMETEHKSGFSKKENLETFYTHCGFI